MFDIILELCIVYILQKMIEHHGASLQEMIQYYSQTSHCLYSARNDCSAYSARIFYLFLMSHTLKVIHF